MVELLSETKPKSNESSNEQKPLSEYEEFLQDLQLEQREQMWKGGNQLTCLQLILKLKKFCPNMAGIIFGLLVRVFSFQKNGNMIVSRLSIPFRRELLAKIASLKWFSKRLKDSMLMHISTLEFLFERKKAKPIRIFFQMPPLSKLISWN